MTASMHQLEHDDLYSLEEYARRRAEFRARVLEHKRHRRLHLGTCLTLCFEDRLTVQYQVQEMLRIERIFEAEAIAGELAAYNPLIPNGHNWKATLLIEFPDPAERARRLRDLVGVEHRIWAEVAGCPRLMAVADEDLERSTAEKTSAVHFLRFELSQEMIRTLKDGAALCFGVDHPACTERLQAVPELVRESLIADLD